MAKFVVEVPDEIVKDWSAAANEVGEAVYLRIFDGFNAFVHYNSPPNGWEFSHLGGDETEAVDALDDVQVRRH